MREQVNFLGMTSCRGGGAKDDQIIKYIGTYVFNLIKLSEPLISYYANRDASRDH